jgi:glycosyltransferase involved in cell wall biosynthesis
MKVLFNRLSALDLKTGVGHYAQELSQCLSSLPACRLGLFPSERWLTWERRLRHSWQRLRALRFRQGRPWAPLGILWGLQGLERTLRRGYQELVSRYHRRLFFGNAFDLYHEPNFIPLPSSLPTVTTIHDLSVLLHPEWHPSARVQWYEDRFPQALKQSAHCITVSEFTRRQTLKHLGLSPDRVTCVPNGFRPEFRPLPADQVAHILRRRNLPPQYLLYVGTIEPRKNLLRLMKAYVSLPDELRRSWPLLLVGNWGWKVENERRYYHDVALRHGVRHVGYVPDADLPALYGGARALLYPSLYEGFGLPPLEMLACGGAVLASRIPPIVEVTAGAAQLIAPEDTEGWRQAMHKVLVDAEWWQELRQDAVATAQPFSWTKCAQRTSAVYRRVLADGREACRAA